MEQAKVAVMDEFCQVWQGQLIVGIKNVGPAVMWSHYNTPIPAIIGNLQVTRLTDFDHLWRFIQGKTVSAFALTSHTPQFLQLTQELTKTQKEEPPVLRGKVIGPREHVEVILAAYRPELQYLGLKNLQDTFQPSLIVILESNMIVKSAVNFGKEHNISEFSQVFEKNTMLDDGVAKDRNEQKHQGHKKTNEIKGRKSKEKKNNVIHTRTSKSRKCLTSVRMNFVKSIEKKEKAMKMQGRQYSEDEKEIKNNAINTKVCIEPDKCSNKTPIPSHIHEGKAIESDFNKVCADKAAGDVLAEKCICKKTSLESKDEESVLTISTFCKSSPEKQQSSVSGKTNMLDTKKFVEFFFSKDIAKPDLIKPSMLKKNLEKNCLKGNVEKFSSQKVEDYYCGVPDLLKHSENFNKTSNRNTEKRPLKESKGFSSHPSLKCKEYDKRDENVQINNSPTEMKCDCTNIINLENRLLKEMERTSDTSQFPTCNPSESLETNVNQQSKKVRDSKSISQFKRKLSTNCLMSKGKDDICIETNKKTNNRVKQLIEDLGFKRKPDETDNGTEIQCTPVKRARIILKDIMKSSNRMKGFRLQDTLKLEDLGFKRKPDETDNGTEIQCTPVKRARIILKDIMKGSNRMKGFRLQDTLKLDDLNDKKYISRQGLNLSYYMDTLQPSVDHGMSKHFMDLKSKTVCGIGSFQESSKVIETSTDEFPHFTCENRFKDDVCFIDHIKEPCSVKQELNSEYMSDMNTVDKEIKTRVNEHAFHTNNSIPDTIEMKTKMNKLQIAQDYPKELNMELKVDMSIHENKSESRMNGHSFHLNNSVPTAIEVQTEMIEFKDCPHDLSNDGEHTSQSCDVECPESDQMINTHGIEVIEPISCMDTPYCSSYPRILKEYKESYSKDCEGNILHEDFKKKYMHQSSDALECTLVNESMNGMCFTDHIQKADTLGEELLCRYKLDINEEKGIKRVKEHVEDFVLDGIDLNAEFNMLSKLQDQPLDFPVCSENSLQSSCQEHPESRGIARTPEHGIEAGTKENNKEMLLNQPLDLSLCSENFPQVFHQQQPESRGMITIKHGLETETKDMDEEMHLCDIPSLALERQLVDKVVAHNIIKPTASTETTLLDCKTALHSLDAKERERLFSSKKPLRRLSLLSLSSLNSCAIEKTESLSSETAILNQIERSPLFENSSVVQDKNRCLISEVSKTFHNLKENNELVSGLREDMICEGGRPMQNNENHPLEISDTPCYGGKDPPNIHMPSEATKKIGHECIEFYDIHSVKSFDITPCRQKEFDVELLLQKMNNRLQTYSLALASHERQISFYGNFKSLANFISTSLNTTPNVKCPAVLTDNSTTGDQQGRNFISVQQVKIFILQQLTKLHAPYHIEKVIMTSHNSSEADALPRCRIPRKYQHSPQHCRQFDCHNGPESTQDILNYKIESKMQSEDNCVPPLKDQTEFQITMFAPNDLYQPSWNGNHAQKSHEDLQMQRYVHLFNADQQDIVKLKCLLVVHDMSYATLEEIKRFGGNIYIRPSALDQLLTHPTLQNICLLPNIQFGVYNSLLTVLNGGAWPILKSKWLLLVDYTAMVDESFVKILQEVLGDKDIYNNHHHCVFIPIQTLETCIYMLENSSEKLTREQELCCILQRNIAMLIECMKMGVAYILGGKSYWGFLSPKSSTTDLLMCLKVIHRCLQFVHRHTAVLVGGSFHDSDKILQNSFYSFCTVANMIKANFDS